MWPRCCSRRAASPRSGSPPLSVHRATPTRPVAPHPARHGRLDCAILAAAPNRRTRPMLAIRLLPPLGLTQDQQGKCPLRLNDQQTLILTLPSNPTTCFRWQLKEAAAPALRSLGPEVYSNPEEVGLVGSAGQSTWRFQAAQPGEGRLLLLYQRPWETEVAPAERFDCLITVK